MEKTDKEIIEELIMRNEEVRRIVEEHHEYERQLKEMDKRIYLTPSEQVMRKKIQKLKLAGKDRLEEIISQYKKSNSLS